MRGKERQQRKLTKPVDDPPCHQKARTPIAAKGSAGSNATTDRATASERRRWPQVNWMWGSYFRTKICTGSRQKNQCRIHLKNWTVSFARSNQTARARLKFDEVVEIVRYVVSDWKQGAQTAADAK